MYVEHVTDLIDAYALGALEPEEVDRVERHIETCAACRSLLDSARATAEKLLTVTPQVTPPAALRGRLMARIHAEAQQKTDADTPNTSNIPAGSVPTIPGSKAGTLSRLVHALFGEQLALADQQAASGDLLRDLLAEPDCVIWPVNGTADAPNASARLIGAPSRRDAVLVTNGLQPAGAGKAYQVWFLSNGKPVPNALFNVNRHGQGSRVVRVTAPLLDFDTVAITPEPEGGSPGPTGPIVLAGSLVAR